MSWEIKVNWDECNYLKRIDEFPSYLGCNHILNKSHECNKKNCPIKV
nr:MAG: hypothetical protein [uncultured archaeon]